MWRAWIKRGHQVFDLWARLRVPVIAAINGHALGGGLELAAAADIRVATTAATFGLPEASIGTVPGWSGTQRLAKLIGANRVKYLALTGRRIDADEAYRIGLLAEPPSADPVGMARAIAADICRLAPVSVQLAKQIVDAGSGEGLAAALEAIAGGLAASTADAREGKLSFAQKRSAHYQGQLSGPAAARQRFLARRHLSGRRRAVRISRRRRCTRRSSPRWPWLDSDWP